MSMLRNFWNDESGPELVEWAVVTIILLVAALVLYVAVGKVLGNVICSIYCWLDLAKNRDGHTNMDGSSCSDITAGEDGSEDCQ